MKYIRTKDDVFELKPDKEQIINGTHYHITNDMYERDYKYKEEDIVKSANTIKELCDEFIVVDERCGHRIALLSGIRPQGVKLYAYGAIWTDKGLIYVAKMNEKGELELL